MSDPFITAADLETFIGEDPGDNADLACAAACDIIRDYVDGELTLEEGVTARLDGTGRDALLLPKPPIREVTTVTESDTALTVDDDYWLGEAGILYRVGCWWPPGRGNIIVEYDRGYDTPAGPYDDPAMALPQAIIAVALAIAKRIAAAGALPVGGFTSETMGQYSYTRADGSTDTFALLQDERAVLDHYRFPRVA